MSTVELLQTYAQRIRNLRRANPDVSEPALAPAFQQLLQALLPELGIAPGLTIVPEFENPGVGRPDIALMRPGVPARAFVELKSPAKSADPTRWRDAHDKRQFARFQELPCWATSNFAEFRLFFLHDEQDSAIVVPEQWLRPDRDDKKANRAIAAHDASAFLDLVKQLCLAAGTDIAVRDAEHLAFLMAHSARFVRGVVQDRLAELHASGDENHALLQVRKEFRDVLYAHPEAAGYSAPDFNALFSAAFAQTLAYGLLLVREGTQRAIGEDAWQHMPPEHPLMRTALKILSMEEVVHDIGIGFSVMCDTVNSFDPKILDIGADGRDPILHFYEDFLKTFDPEARERFGVYYTPIEVVRYMVGALDRALRENLGTEGLSDSGVTILDPATGTGTFLLGIAEHVRNQSTTSGDGMAGLALRDLATRMFGFELLVGPYAVAHYRLHHALRRGDSAGQTAPLPRLGVYLADTLSRPDAAAALGSLGFVSDGMANERAAANAIKARREILAIIGNPPYRRLEEGENRTLVGDWMNGLWDDLKEPVKAAGQGNQLNTFPELSVAFWRWAIWKLFEAENAPKRGVIAFITNRKFLTGWPYAGLRQMMRQRFDCIEIFDLRGDVRRGERAGVDSDQGVFNIQVGTAITIAIADGSKPEGQLADILYADSWTDGLFSRRAKLQALTVRNESGTCPNPVTVHRDPLDDMRPKPFQSGDWVSLAECFLFSHSGIQTKRDHFVYSPSRTVLIERLENFAKMNDNAASEAFHGTSARPWNKARSIPFAGSWLQLVSYRPLDKRWLYNHEKYLDRPRPELQEVWGLDNFGIYALPSGTGAGPAAWCYSLLPDYHAFRGSYGGYAFPLFNRMLGANTPNISLELIQALSAAYGETIGAETVFDVILCLLSASSYALRFAEDLEDTFPHIVFPAQYKVFQDAVRIGGKIRAVETFARAPGSKYLMPSFVRLDTEPQGVVAFSEIAGETLTLCADGSGKITGLPQAVWDFTVSGYRVLPRWLEARAGLPADLAFIREFRDICGRIAELIDLFAEADTVLAAALAQSLSREALHFAGDVAHER